MSDETGPRPRAADDASVGTAMKERINNELRMTLGTAGVYRDCDCPIRYGRCTCEAPKKE